MTEAKVIVKHAILPSLSLDKLRQLRSLNLGQNGLMIEPIRKTIAYKKGIATPLSIVSKMHNSKIAYIELDGQIVSWGLLLSEDHDILTARCAVEGVKPSKVMYEIHLYTKKLYRGKGFATKIAKSVRRKYTKTRFFGYWDESSIFCKSNLVKLVRKDRERAIKAKRAKA